MHSVASSEVGTTSSRLPWGSRAVLGGTAARWWAVLDRPARLSFGLTLLKLPITAVAFALIVSYQLLPRTLLEVVAVALVTTAAVLDVADGLVFRRSAHAGDKSIRDQRRVLDVACDRVLIVGTVVPLAFIGFPLLAVGLILTRELIAAIICGVPYWRRGFVTTPNLAARAATTLIGVQVVYYCLGNPLSLLLSAAFCVAAVWSLAQYRLFPREN